MIIIIMIISFLYGLINNIVFAIYKSQFANSAANSAVINKSKNLKIIV